MYSVFRNTEYATNGLLLNSSSSPRYLITKDCVLLYYTVFRHVLHRSIVYTHHLYNTTNSPIRISASWGGG